MTTPVPDRQFLSQFTDTTMGLLIHVQGVLGDVDSNAMTVVMTPDAGGAPVFSRSATHVSTGTYQVELTSSDTDNAGLFTLTWNYQINHVAQSYPTYIEIGVAGSAYNALDQDMKDIIEQTWSRFDDGFDSPQGGPVLSTYVQSKFNRNRLAQLLQLAMNKLNGVSQPWQSFTIQPGPSKFPTAKWGGLLEMGLYIETIKHLMRSYVEDPTVEGGGSYARLNRQNYLERWGTILAIEEDDYRRELGVYKMAYRGLGQPRVLVSGGVYPNYNDSRMFSGEIARPHWFARWY